MREREKQRGWERVGRSKSRTGRAEEERTRAAEEDKRERVGEREG